MSRQWLLILAVLALILLAVLCAFVIDGPRIESDLRARAEIAAADVLAVSPAQIVAAAAAGVDPITLTVDGRDATLQGRVVDAATRDAVVAAVRDVRGMRTVDDRLDVDAPDAADGIPA
ncbi:MAG: BON domain-containing protein, partial [Acidobacteriota bacterium]